MYEIKRPPLRLAPDGLRAAGPKGTGCKAQTSVVRRGRAASSVWTTSSGIVSFGSDFDCGKSPAPLAFVTRLKEGYPPQPDVIQHN